MAKLNTDLTGDALLRDLASTGKTDLLEVLWRAEEPGLSARLLPLIGATKDTRLGGLVLNAYLSPRLPPPVLEAVLKAAASPEPPRLARPDAARLVEHLRGQRSQQGRFPPGRVNAEMWALAQDGPEVLAIAKEIATSAFPFSGNENVLNLARRRATQTPKSRDEVAARLSERLTGERGQPAWARAAGFLDLLPGDQHSAAIAHLTDQIVESAPANAQAVFSQTLKDRLSAAPEATEKRLSQGAIPNAAAGQSFVQVIEGVADPAARARMTSLVLLQHPDLYQAMRQPISKFTDEEWAIRLGGLIGSGPTRAMPSLIDFLGRAPLVHAPLVMKVAAGQGAPAHQSLQTATVAKVKARFQEIVATGFRPEAVEALAWPKDSADSIAPMTKATLKAAIPNDSRAILVGEAVAVGSLGPDAAPALLETSEYAGVLSPADLQGDRLRAVAVSLYEAEPTHMHNVIRQAQTKAFVTDLARAIAPLSAEAAFAGAAAAYRDLPDGDKNDLIDLLEQHGNWKQEELLAAIASETSPKGAQRRMRAIEMTGRVAPTDGAVPAFVVEAVSTSRRDLLEMTFGVIARLRPRDAELAHRLREVAEADGAPGRAAAASALSELTAGYAAALENASSHDERALLLSLLGATARLESIDVLLRYLGGEAEDDHPAVKQAAARGLADAVRVVRFTADQLRQLGELLDGPQPEGDPAARAILVDVLGRATLGEDQALTVFHDLIGRTPKDDPAALYGAEKSRLLRAAALYESSRSLGEAGWPGVIEQLDNMAMCVTRAAYLVAGDNEPPKELIRTDPRRPDYGALLNMLNGDLASAKGPLLTLHKARSEETEYTHPGTKPTQDTVTTARTNFGQGVKVLVGVIEKTIRSKKSSASPP